MNKIKIVNQEILHLMQTNAKEFKVVQEIRKENPSVIRRPMTPQQIFRSVIREGAESDMHFKRKERLRTSQVNFGATCGSRMEGSEDKARPQSPTIIERKIELAKHEKERPNTANEFRRRNHKMKTQKFQQREDISGLKHDIDEVLTEIKEENDLCRMRMKVKYSEYGLKKFGKYWHMHKVNLDRKTTTDFHPRTTNIFSEQKSTNKVTLPRYPFHKITKP